MVERIAFIVLGAIFLLTALHRHGKSLFGFMLDCSLDLIFRGSGECAEKGWTFLGVAIAG